MEPAGKRFVILGAGGAARAISVELALAGAAALTLVNRSPERGRVLVEHLRNELSAQAEFIYSVGTYAVDGKVDVLVNATSIGLYPDVDAMPAVDLAGAKSGMLVCDVVPKPPDTRLIQSARARGLPTQDGLAMVKFGRGV